MKTSGLNHIIPTIGNVGKSCSFNGDLLGFELKEVADGFFFIMGDIAVSLFPSAQPTQDDNFSGFRVGHDHLAFTAPNATALYSIVDKFLAGTGLRTGVRRVRREWER